MYDDIKISGFIDLSITPSIINLVREAPDRNHIGALIDRIFDIIKDFFCWTNMTEAKKCLYDLYAYRDAPKNEEATDKVKRLSVLKNSYDRLKELAGANYKSNFFEIKETSGYSINIDFGGAVNNYKFNFNICNNDYIDREIQADFGKFLANRDASKYRDFYKDLSRSTYIVNKKNFDNTACVDLDSNKNTRRSIKRFDAALESNFKVTHAQLEALKLLSHQGTIAIIIGSSMHQNGGVFQSAPIAFLENQEKVIFSYNNKGRDIKVHCAVNFSWSDRLRLELFGEKERPGFLNKAWVSGDFIVDPEGKIAVSRATVGTI